MTDDELNAIEARVANATPGPWHWAWDEDTNPPLGDTYGVSRPNGQQNSPVARTHRFKQGYEDALFIAHARVDVPALLAEVRRLRPEPHRIGDGRCIHSCEHTEAEKAEYLEGLHPNVIAYLAELAELGRRDQ